jgi:phospholipase C
MLQKKGNREWLRAVLASASLSLAMLGPASRTLIPIMAAVEEEKTPIDHVIVIVGENHTYDNVFGGYVPTGGQTAWNLLSEGIINADGSPGPHFSNAFQNVATDSTVTPGTYSPTPPTAPGPANLQTPDTTYAYGLTPNVPDSRWTATPLLNGPFPLVKHGSNLNGADYFGSFTGDPVHRFFQMWQDYDGGKLDLFPWVGETIGIGRNGLRFPSTLIKAALQWAFTI